MYIYILCSIHRHVYIMSDHSSRGQDCKFKLPDDFLDFFLSSGGTEVYFTNNYSLTDL